MYCQMIKYDIGFDPAGKILSSPDIDQQIGQYSNTRKAYSLIELQKKMIGILVLFFFLKTAQ